jgi:hypothetical protein
VFATGACQVLAMSANEIIAELPKLNRQDLERLDVRLHQLLNPTDSDEKRGGKPIGQVMLEFAGRAQGLPEDCGRFNQ